jgi:hypothetical protein
MMTTTANLLANISTSLFLLWKCLALSIVY